MLSASLHKTFPSHKWNFKNCTLYACARAHTHIYIYAPSHRQDNTYHGLCYTSRGALAGTRNSSMGPPWRIDPTTHRTMSGRSHHGATSRSRCREIPRPALICVSHISKNLWILNIFSSFDTVIHIAFEHIPVCAQNNNNNRNDNNNNSCSSSSGSSSSSSSSSSSITIGESTLFI